MKLVNFKDLIKPFPPCRKAGESLEDYKQRNINKITPLFKEMMLFNESAGVLDCSLREALGNNTLEEFAEGYVSLCFDNIDLETFELIEIESFD